MKISSKIFGFVVSLVAIMLSIPSFALADTDSRKGADGMERGMEEKMEEHMDDKMSSSADEDYDDKEMDKDTDDGRMEGMMGGEHRSKVVEAVLKLVELAGKDKNIGEEISEIAKEENESSGRAAEAIKEVEARGKFKTFLFGTDYKNIGALRSEMVRSDNNIDRLTKAKDRTIDQAVKAELDVQIAVFQKANDEAEAFVKANESKFSIFGWLFKLFSN